MDVAETVTPDLSDDLFSAAFDEAVIGDVEEKPAGVVEQAEAETEQAAEQAEAETEQAVTPEPKPEPVKEAAAAPVVDVRSLVSEIVEATKPKLVEPEPSAPVGPTPEEVAAEEQFKKDWPEHAAREARLHQEIENLKALLTETVTSLTGQIKPLAETVQMTAQDKHLNTIRTAHPDAFDLVPDVDRWIETQPKLLQGEFKRVLDTGNAAEIVELFDLFKQSTGTKPAVVDPKVEQDKKARLKKMETPTTARTSATAEADPDDFDSAFEAEAKKYVVR